MRRSHLTVSFSSTKVISIGSEFSISSSCDTVRAPVGRCITSPAVARLAPSPSAPNLAIHSMAASGSTKQ